MKGKEKCKILREIRRKIAEENDIPFVTRDCPYQGECGAPVPAARASCANWNRRWRRAAAPESAWRSPRCARA